MNRYFIELSYLGTGYAGFQVQQNAVTIQGAVEQALEIFMRQKVVLTGSSRTDAGVHARQNYFHFDMEGEMQQRWIYNINSLLPAGIAVNSIRRVQAGAHCRFDALWREYSYSVYGRKDPFISDRAYYYPYRLDMGRMEDAAAMIGEYSMFGAFAKRNSQVKTVVCRIMESRWETDGAVMVYRVRANRFLRGMVRGLVGTMLQVGRGKLGLAEFREVIEGGESARADFSVPGQGLCLEKVEYPGGYFD